jgi:phosphate-selective porin OprO/OprP
MGIHNKPARNMGRRQAVWARLLALAAVPVSMLDPSISVADEPPQYVAAAPLSDYLAGQDSWGDPAVALAPASKAGGPISQEASLAQRVEALEQYIREQEAKTREAEEGLPAAERKTGAANECAPKKVDILVKPTFQPLGRIYFDGVVYDDDNEAADFFATDRNNELGFRTFRIGGKGNIYENLAYTLEVELRGTDISYKDIYMEQQSLPWFGNFRAGHFKEPIGLEEFGSDLFNTFMEKVPATSTFAPSRNFGVMVYDRFDERDEATWFAGLFRADSPDVPVSTGLWRDDRNDWSFSGRLAWLPYYDEPSNGRFLVHLGGSYSYRKTADVFGNQNVAANGNGLAEFSTRAWVGSQAPIGVGAEGNSDAWNQLGGELLVIWGALSLQSEYFHAILTSGEDFNGAYVLVSYFLTGENRAYRKDRKVIDRTVPFEPAFWIDAAEGWRCGLGAWELAAGYSFVDLESGHDISATRQRAFVDGIVFGVNWYHNPWSRLTFDYTHEMSDFVAALTPDSNANIFGIRWQVDW